MCAAIDNVLSVPVLQRILIIVGESTFFMLELVSDCSVFLSH